MGQMKKTSAFRFRISSILIGIAAASGLLGYSEAHAQACSANPQAAAMAACQAVFPNCVDTATFSGPANAFGVIGFAAGFSAGSNCSPPTAWQMFCYATGYDSYNCAQCTQGEIQRSHTPCNCNPGTTPSIGNWCVPQQSVCGDGATNPGEQCDDGNTANGDCCSSTCTFEAAGTVCRASAGVCDQAENCTGSSAACPSDAKVASGSTCRAAAGVCDILEACDGTSDACPSDTFEPNSTVCRGAAGVCDTAENCTGSSAACPSDAKVASGTTCRAAAGVCDILEACDGASDACPSDAVQPTSTLCRAGSGDPNGSGFVCDPDEFCDGAAVNCPPDVFSNAVTVCNAGTNGTDGLREAICDPQEFCPGTAGAACPADTVAPTTTVCDSGSGDPNGSGFVCDPTEHCTGTADVACPTDAFSSAATVCNPGSTAADNSRDAVCDPDEHCPGAANAACPADTYKVAGFVCDNGTNTADASRDNVCDPQETCSGTPDSACPADIVLPSTTVCDIGSGNPNGGLVCDPDEHCTGTANQACPSDTFSNAASICRGDAGQCDVADYCPGSAGAACPNDGFEANLTPCGSSSDTECTDPDSCDGAGNCLPHHAAAATQCYGPGPNSVGFDPAGNNCTHACDGAGSCASSITPNCCGNGIVEMSEQCDDGNQYTGGTPAPDGSPELCPSDPSFQCTYTAGGGSLWIRGSRKNPSRDTRGCQHQFVVINPNQPLDKHGLRDFHQTCLDQDPTCDFDPIPGRCGFIVVICANTADPNLPACTPAGLTSLEVRPLSTALAANPVVGSTYQANVAALTAAASQLFDPVNPGAGFTNGAPLAPGQVNLCSAPQTVTVFAASARSNESARARFTLRTKSADDRVPRPARKPAKLRLTCLARTL